MIGRSKRLFQALGAVLTNRQKTIRQAGALFATDPVEALANGGRHCCGHGFPGSLRELFGQSMLHRRLRRPDHHGRRRGRPAPPLAREARRGRAGGPVRQPHRPARHRDRGPQPALVRAQHRPGRHRGPAAGSPSGEAVDGGDAGRHGRGHRGGVRGQVHAAVVVLGGSGGRKAHGPAAAQYVGDQRQGRRCCRSSPAAANGSR